VLQFFSGLISTLLTLFQLALVVRVFVSWVFPTASSPLIDLARRVTEPLLREIRRLLPVMGGLDWSPLAALLLIQFVDLLQRRFWFWLAGGFSGF